MIRLKNILSENMHRFGTKNLNEQDSDANNNGYPDKTEKTGYQTLAQRGELPGLDPQMDMEFLNSLITRLEKLYDLVKYRRIDMSNFKKDVMDLYEKYKTPKSSDLGTNNQEHANFHREFKSMYPISTTYSGWKGISNQISSKLSTIYRLTKAIADGDTSMFGYRQTHLSEQTDADANNNGYPDESEHTVDANNRSRQIYLRGNLNLLKQHPEAQMIADNFLAKLGKEEIRDLDVDEMMNLNFKIQSFISKDTIDPGPPKGDFGDRSRGYMGSKYTGD